MAHRSLAREDQDTKNLMRLIDRSLDSARWTDELGGDGADAIYYDDNPVLARQRRVRESEVATLAAIALLLPRRYEEMLGRMAALGQTTQVSGGRLRTCSTADS